MLSHRHHYIPEFFIKGFINPSKQMWVYNKITDRISPKQYYPRSIFFKNGGNTISVNNKDIDIIESEIYKYLDNILSRQFKIIQDNAKPDFADPALFYYINIMAATLYYRKPSSESERVSNLSQLNSLKNIQESWLETQIINAQNLNINQDDKYKFLSCLLPFIGLKLFGKNNFHPDTSYTTFNIRRPGFILSDYPIITQNPLNNFIDLASNLIFPLTSKRLFCCVEGVSKTINLKKVKSINLILAIQAKKYFCSEDKEILEMSVQLYKNAIKFNLDLVEARELLFNNILDKRGVKKS